MSIEDTIKSKLTDIERKENFKIIYACESGSRAWGFNSPDSDYDVRFIYLRNTIDYLKINPLKDTYEGELNDVYDINGWDVKKMLGLLLKSNPIIFEWNMSPIVYKHTEEWDVIKDVLDDYVSPRSLLYHYYSIAKGVYSTHFKEDHVILKKYFYVVRPLLAGAYVLGEEDIPPMAFEELAKEYLPLNLKYDVEHLLAIKKSSNEKVIGDRIPRIDEWIESELERLYSKLGELPKLELKSDKQLTELFYKLLNK